MLNADLFDDKELELRKQIFKLQQCIADFKNYDEKRKKHIEKLEKENQELNTRISDFLNMIEDMQDVKLVTKLHRKIASLKNEISGKQKVIDEYKLKISSIKPEILDMISNHNILYFADKARTQALLITKLQNKVEQLQKDNSNLCYRLLHEKNYN